VVRAIRPRQLFDGGILQGQSHTTDNDRLERRLFSSRLLCADSSNCRDRTAGKALYRNHLRKIDDPHGIHTQSVELTESNVRDAILASGSLPVIMRGINNIADAPVGCYRDGGIVDYHFDFQVNGNSSGDSSNEDLILYPHFSANLRAGWFDKKLSRQVYAEHYERVVLLCPSEQFISKLPYGKIPDRSDFSKLSTEERMKFWWRATNDSKHLAEEFARFLHKPDWTRVRPITDLTA